MIGQNNNDQSAMLSPDPVSPVGANIYHMRGEARRRTYLPPLYIAFENSYWTRAFKLEEPFS